jgi:transcription termination factor NusB
MNSPVTRDRYTTRLMRFSLSLELKELYKSVISLISKFKNIKIKLIPREQNKQADTFSYQAYQRFLDNNPQLHKNIAQYMAIQRQIARLRKVGIPPRKYHSKEEAASLISNMLKPP